MFGIFKSQNRPVSGINDSQNRSASPMNQSQNRSVNNSQNRQVTRNTQSQNRSATDMYKNANQREANGIQEEEHGSSDDDDKSASQSQAGSIYEDEDFIKTGNKGIIVFSNIYCVKTCRYKTFHLYLNSGILYQYAGRSRKKFNCSDIQEIRKNANNQVIVTIKHSMELSSKKKKYCFDSDAAYEEFKKYVEFMNDTGSTIRSAFEAIDTRGVKTINKSNLKAAMNRHDIEVTDQDLTKM
jgi:hypothetical protein